MAKLIELPSFQDKRGTLTVIEGVLPFTIKRVYYIYDVNDLPRGGHRHRVTRQILICMQGSCNIEVKREGMEQQFSLLSPERGLLLEPEDWHRIQFLGQSILLVLASNLYTPEDCICDSL